MKQGLRTPGGGGSLEPPPPFFQESHERTRDELTGRFRGMGGTQAPPPHIPTPLPTTSPENIEEVWTTFGINLAPQKKFF